MAKSTFKGSIKTGAISAKFSADAANSGSALPTAQYADFDGEDPQVDHQVVAPGGSGTVSVTPSKKGLLEIMVDMSADTDSGQLQVSREGKVVNDEPIQGSVRWTYAVAE